MRWYTVHETLKELPDSAIERIIGRPAKKDEYSSTYDWTTERIALAYTDLELGWKVAKVCAATRQPLPTALAIEDEMIFRAWCYLMDPVRYRDPAILHARAWHTDQRFSRNLKTDLQALLIAKHSSIADVAQALKQPYDYVNAYQVLFFNIMGRKDDLAWLKQFVYPDTRMVEFFADYVEKPPLQKLLMRAGYTNGVEHVLQLTGISTDPVSALGSAGNAQQMEAFLLSNAMLMASSGWFNNTTHAAAIYHARQLMTAAKLGGDTQVEPAPLQSLASMISAELLAVKKPQAEDALRKTFQSEQFGSHGRAVVVDAPPSVDDIPTQ